MNRTHGNRSWLYPPPHPPNVFQHINEMFLPILQDTKPTFSSEQSKLNKNMLVATFNTLIKGSEAVESRNFTRTFQHIERETYNVFLHTFYEQNLQIKSYKKHIYSDCTGSDRCADQFYINLQSLTPISSTKRKLFTACC